MDTWDKYKQNLVISNESFDRIEDIYIREIFNYIRNILDKSPDLRNKIRTSGDTNLQNLIP